MEKSKIYKHSFFNADLIKQSFKENFKEKASRESFRLRRDEESWEFDNESEFFAEYRKKHDSSSIRKSNSELSISIAYNKGMETTITVQAKDREKIESIFELFEQNFEKSKTSDVKQKIFTIFIGHGRSSQWRELKDHLSDKHGYKIEAYETGARAGHTIRDILEEMSMKSSFAILVLTGEDKDGDGKLHPRPNVIHETGLFQGKLGFSKAIVLLEEGTEEFSNLYGIQQIRYSKNNIKEVFGEILATIKREFEL
jgi:predicted nucleotide-binding protein